ncbi:MAG: biotin--[acetyl-CoA-carboxylase] ligase [Oscillospiraceae bacterium]|nr:biotin--[acetyl-CoA-carboxylase] ligase [Oscillospiraceae bacterium]
MTIKDQLYGILEENRGKFISGEDIAKQLYCTRGAVWKAIKALKEEGFEISAVTNRGYCLNEGSDILSEAGIKRYLSNNRGIIVLKTTTSTNKYLRELAQEGAEEGTLVVSGEQTDGYGRRKRSFFSPPDTGLYMSILLRPNFSAQDAVKITAAGAVSVCNAIEKVIGITTNIKWVNDIYVNGKKTAGILTEAVLNIENGLLDYTVMGIGINVYKPKNGFPYELSDIAGALINERTTDVNIRNRLAAEIYGNFMELYGKLPECVYLDEYRKRLMWQGERIVILSGTDGKTETPAVLLGTDENCALRVRYDNGNEDTLSSGEISISK